VLVAQLVRAADS